MGLTRYSAKIYDHGGCDGETCAIAMLVHGAPFLLSWVLCWAVWLSSFINRRTKGVLGFSILLNILVGVLVWNIDMDELYLPSFVLLFAQGLVLTKFILGSKKS